jgi:hypothetical protein
VTKEFPNPKRRRKTRHEVHRWTLVAVPFAGIPILGYLVGVAGQLGVVGTAFAVTLVIFGATKILFGWPRLLPRQRTRPPVTSPTASSQADLVPSGATTD